MRLFLTLFDRIGDHLRSNDRETFATGAGCFNQNVQSKQVRLALIALEWSA